MTGTELPLAADGGATLMAFWPILLALLGIAGAWGAWRLKLKFLCQEVAELHDTIKTMEEAMKKKQSLTSCEKEHARLSEELDRGQKHFDTLRCGQTATQELLARVDERVKIFDSFTKSLSEMAKGINSLAQAMSEDVKLRKQQHYQGGPP